MRTLVAVMCLCLVLLQVSPAFGAAWYVDGKNGNDSRDGRSVSNAWKTIAKANSTVVGGDSVYILAGSYAESIRPAQSGSKLSRITYLNHGSEIVVLTGVSIAINLDKRSYVTVHGIQAHKVTMYALLDSSRHVWIEDCRFDSANTTGAWPTGVRIRNNSRLNRITGCTIGRVGYCVSDDDKGGVFIIGTWENLKDSCDSNLLENCTIHHGGHHLIELVGRRNVIRNNHFHNEPWMACSRPGGHCGNRLIVVGYNPQQCRQNLFEGNRFTYSGVPPDQNTSAGMSIRTPHNIVRRNVFCFNDGSGLDVSTYDSTFDARYNRVYHNTFYRNGHSLLAGVERWKQGGMGIARHGNSKATTGLSILNNLFHDNRSDAIVFYYVSRDSQLMIRNWEHAGDPEFVNASALTSPSDQSLPDLCLKRQSLCIDSGAFLTTITSADGSGNLLQVADAGFFTDGWGIVEGDIIQLQGENETARITAIDYASNTITVDRNVAWKRGAAIAQAYSGSAPDIGAFEYTPPAQTAPAIPLRESLRTKGERTTQIEYFTVTGVRIRYAAAGRHVGICISMDRAGRVAKLAMVLR